MPAPWKESYDQPRQHIEKQRHYFINKVCLVKAVVFPVVMYGCESWTIKKELEGMLEGSSSFYNFREEVSMALKGAFVELKKKKKKRKN